MSDRGVQPDFVNVYIRSNGVVDTTLLLLHGTGCNEHDLVSLGESLLPGAAILSPRGKVLENGMPRFFRRLAMGVFDQEDLKFRTEELAAFVQHSAARLGFDPQKVVAVGYSNGANIAASLLLRFPKLLAGAVLLHPMLPFTPDVAPNLTGVPILITGGRRDAMIPPVQTESLIAVLQQAGARVTVEWTTGGHEIRPEELRKAQDWFGNFAAAKTTT